MFFSVRARFLRGVGAPSMPSRRRSVFTVRQSMSVMRSCITNMSSRLEGQGAIFVEELDEVEDTTNGYLFRAWRAEIDSKGCQARNISIDATCRWSPRSTARPNCIISKAASFSCRHADIRKLSAHWDNCQIIRSSWFRPGGCR